MTREKILAAVLLAGALALGGALGAAGYSWAAGDDRCARPGGRESYVDRLTTELRLSPEQRGQVIVILERQREELAAIWREVKPRTEEIRQAARAEIRGVLTPEQQERYTELLQRSERERARRGKER